jgi:hypothetical protein
MRFMVMHKVDAKMEAGSPPDQQIISKMGALVQGSLKQGVFLNGAGLHRSARRARLECRGGECQVSHGPYTGKNELVSAFTMISAKSMTDALGHARTLASQLGDVDIEVGPVVEPWDLGLMPKPENAPERFLLLTKATPADESAGGAARHAAATAHLAASLPAEAAVLAADSLAPSAKASRLRIENPGKRVWVDGPFAESKELIAGFSLLQLPSMAEAVAWAERYAAILLDAEVDVRQVNEP